ncbi:hypothetical protein LTR36_006601 [Oleoguttula mirabilis]|uniref:Tubulin-tyrosine ligase n=1 Tax=Oleoguttula mirabilis TaxID=1507867 RepID=A0AAV9JC50_9PEZI|nr:hypothetical protein LTR36_006601 [Oleoguttula mirabilis]
MGPVDKIYAHIDYEDAYVQPLLLAALKARLPPDLLILVNETSAPPPLDGKLLQWRQYENIDFEHLLQHPHTNLANSYVIRKALIRKHYLSTTVSHWLTKHPESNVLRDHVKPSVEFEVDYAEFLDDALVEAFELRESWARGEGKGAAGREWWILKPGMSERGQGIRLFSSEEELGAIFEEWDPPSDDEDEDEDEHGDRAQHSGTDDDEHDGGEARGNSAHTGVVTSHLRHFIAQPYIHPPLLLPSPHPSAGRKFHIRTYVLAVGALKVYVYKPMLALFAGQAYTAPTSSVAEEGSEAVASPNDELARHLTNTCLQSGEREGSVHAFWSLPRCHLDNNNNNNTNDNTTTTTTTTTTLSPTSPAAPDSDWRQAVFTQICDITGEVFEAAARSMSIHFQPLPNAFEIFGLDFMVDAEGAAWLLEVNAFPDFAQTGGELQGLIAGLFEEVVEYGVKPFFGLPGEEGDGDGDGEANGEESRDRNGERMVMVLDIDLGRR